MKMSNWQDEPDFVKWISHRYSIDLCIVLGWSSQQAESDNIELVYEAWVASKRTSLMRIGVLLASANGNSKAVTHALNSEWGKVGLGDVPTRTFSSGIDGDAVFRMLKDPKNTG